MSISSTRIKALGILALLVLMSVGVYQCNYKLSLWADYRDRPWAYNRDKDAPLLVGTWQGSFTDPDGISKSIEMEIVEPLTDKERRKKSNRSHRRRTRGGLGGRKEKRIFDGVATVTSKLGTERYVLSGSVKEDDHHQFKLGFGAEDEAKRLQPNFCLNLADSGHWDADQLRFRTGFAYFTAQGSSFSDSSDPRHDYTTLVILNRKK